MLNRELAKGPEANPLVANNSELLKAQSLARIQETIDALEKAGALGPSVQDQMQAVVLEQQKTASIDKTIPETAADEPEAASGDQDSVGEVLADVSPNPLSALPEAVPTPDTPPHNTSLRNEAELAQRIDTPQKTPSAVEGFPVTFAVPVTWEPTAPGSEVRIYRDENGKIIPAHRLDRRIVERKVSNLPRLSEVAEEYFDARSIKVGKDNKDLRTARNRLNIFLELIGDHPVDTYAGADLQAYIALMTHWPALSRARVWLIALKP